MIDWLISLTVGAETAELNSKLSELIQSTGPDKQYTFMGSEDLRPYNISAQFILQVFMFI